MGQDLREEIAGKIAVVSWRVITVSRTWRSVSSARKSCSERIGVGPSRERMIASATFPAAPP